MCELYDRHTPLLGIGQQQPHFGHQIVRLKTSPNAGSQLIFVLVSEFELNVGQKFIDIRQLKDLLKCHHKYQFKFIVQFVLKREIVVCERINARTFLLVYNRKGFCIRVCSCITHEL